MRLNNGYSHASIISGFILFFFCVIFGLEVLTRGIISVKLVHQMPPISHHCQFIVYLAFGLTSLFTSKKNTRALSHEFKLVSFSSCSCVTRNKRRQFHSVLFVSEECFCLAKWLLSRSARWSSQINIITLSLFLRKYETRNNKLIITQGASTLWFFGIFDYTISVVF